MYLTVIIGETGSGKSVLAKEYVLRAPFVNVYDMQNEYGLPRFPESKTKFCITPKQGIEKFISLCSNTTGFTHVIEESTGVFKHSVGRDFINAVLSKRHDNNNYIIISHQIHRVPTDLMEFADIIILFRTGDLLKNVKSKYPELVPVFNYLQKSAVKKSSPDGTFQINDYVILKKSNLSKNL